MIIYKTTNLINSKIYVGQDSKNNYNYLGSGIIIKKAIKKYGKENFKKEIIEYCNDKQKLDNVDYVDTEIIVDDLYLKILHRSADIQGLEYFSSFLKNGKMTVDDIREKLLNSEEYKTVSR